MRKLHLGCGTVAPIDWINIDSSWNAWISQFPIIKKALAFLLQDNQLEIDWPKNILIHDLTKNLPFPDNSIDCIYSSHTLEHLYLDDAKNLLKECYRVLKKGGFIRIVVPDLQSYAKTYLSKKTRGAFWDTKAEEFLEQIRLREKSPKSGGFIARLYKNLNDTSSHKWMYDLDSLTFYLEHSGLKRIKQKKYGESKIKNIKKIEQKLRFVNSICVEAQK